MSTGTNPQVDPNVIEATRQQINRLFEEVARLSEMDLTPPDYYGAFLKRALSALAAPAGAVWCRTPQGNFQLQYQINLKDVGLDKTDDNRLMHDQLLRQAVIKPQPMQVPPHSSEGPAANARTIPAGNPSDFMILLVPVVTDNQVSGLVEIFQSPDRHPSAVQGFMQFLTHMAELASRYARNNMLRQMVGQQQLWTQLEAFARQVHGSLNPAEVGYIVANEGRRLVDCDRVSIAARYGRRTSVEAVSGSDVVEKRSNLVQLMRKLFDRVLVWGEKLVYTGEKDEGLPPEILDALDKYLAESNSKLLVVLPLRDERESENKKPPRSALMMECFEPSQAPEQLIARLEVVGRHATTALYNSIEHRRIPMRFIWLPLAKIQDGLGGKARAIIAGVVAGLLVLLLAMIFVPYPLKMDANGQLLPEARQWVYSPKDGRVEGFRVKMGDSFAEDYSLVEMYDPDLSAQVMQLSKDIESADNQIRALVRAYQEAPTPDQRPKIELDKTTAEAARSAKDKQLNALLELTHGDRTKPGYYWVRAPKFPALNRQELPRDREWTVLNGDFMETFTTKTVRPSERLLRLGDKTGAWEIELRIPQRHIGQVLQAFETQGSDKSLDVDILVKTMPTRGYKGKLARTSIGGEASPSQNENGEPEPVTLAYVRIEGDDIPESDRLPRDKYLLVAGAEVHAKIRCGNHAMGYSLFYGVWEFLYEKVVFFF